MIQSLLPAQLSHGSSFLPKALIVTSDEPYALQIAIAQELKPQLEQIGVPSCDGRKIQEIDSKHNLDQSILRFSSGNTGSVLDIYELNELFNTQADH